MVSVPLVRKDHPWSDEQIATMAMLRLVIGQPDNISRTNFKHDPPHMRIVWGSIFVIVGPHGNIKPTIYMGDSSQDDIMNSLMLIRQLQQGE